MLKVVSIARPCLSVHSRHLNQRVSAEYRANPARVLNFLREITVLAAHKCLMYSSDFKNFLEAEVRNDDEDSFKALYPQLLLRDLGLSSPLSTSMLMVLKKYLTSQPHRRDRLWLCQYSGSCR